MVKNVHELHLAVAEFGKILALKHQHAQALQHYREAIRMAVSAKAPEVFFRHYSQCVLESLELMGAYGEVIEFCQKADRHYSALTVSLDLHKKDLGSVLERWGINLVKMGEISAAKEKLQRIFADCGPIKFPLAEELIQWLTKGLHVDSSRLLALQKKHQYFVVRADQVNAAKARSLDSLNVNRSLAPVVGI
jgi:tetratricopeptide (TPR) repeat protein